MALRAFRFTFRGGTLIHSFLISCHLDVYLPASELHSQIPLFPDFNSLNISINFFFRFSKDLAEQGPIPAYLIPAPAVYVP